jgi:hypothetical protein
MGAVLAFIGFLSVAVLTTVYSVLMVFSPVSERPNAATTERLKTGHCR